MKLLHRPNTSHDIGNRTIWDSRSVAVETTVLAIYKGDIFILAGRRGSGAADYQNCWNIPAGYLDWDESGPDASRREVWEETGIDLWSLYKNINHKILCSHLIEPWSTRTDPQSNRQNVALRYGMVLKVKKLPELTTINCEVNEVSDLMWMPIKDLDSYKWAFNHHIVIRQYLCLTKVTTWWFKLKNIFK